MIKNRIILGIDPGTNIMGYGLIEIKGNQPFMLAIGIIDLQKFKDPFVKLQKIFERVVGLIEEFQPAELAIEAPFYGKNVQSMLKLGRAQGVAISAGLFKALPIYEYAPRKIKQSITGQGSASKEQVAGMLQHVLDLKELPSDLDATDGLAAALCHFYQNSKPITDGKSYSGWKDFLSKNPGRVG